MIDPVTKIIGTGDNNIKVFKNFLEPEDLTKCIDFYKSINDKIVTKKHHVYQPLSDDLEFLTLKYRSIVIENAKKSYGVDFVDDGQAFSFYVHPIGSFMGPHTDLADKYEGDYIKLNKDDIDSIRPWREDVPFGWTGHLANLIYINDDFDGGELYFPDRNITIRPEPGMLVTFPGNEHYRHGVKPNYNTIRYNLSYFLKFKDYTVY